VPAKIDFVRGLLAPFLSSFAALLSSTLANIGSGCLAALGGRPIVHNH
jgi:hypothetical protein